MGKPVTGINPAVLKWARERAGYTIQEIAARFGYDSGIVVAWEAGDGAPTYAQLEKLAYQLYKRPLAVFFFPQPPSEPDLTSEFRTLPESEIEELEPDVFYALREAAAMQLSLIELNEGINPAEEKIFADVKAHATAARPTANAIRAYLGVEISDQTNWKSDEDALKEWRSLVQEHGVFVFKRSFTTDDISGFSLMHDEFPLIYLNNGSSTRRQIFTLFHELGHVLLQFSGVTRMDDRHIEILRGLPRRVEVFCNQFASEFLVPSQGLQQWLRPERVDDEDIASLADRYWVSREVVLRKFLDRGLVSADFYRQKADEWNEEYRAQKKARKAQRKGSGNYYATQATYLGDRYLNLVFRKYHQGRFNRDQLADYLNVKVPSVSGLEHFMLGKATK